MPALWALVAWTLGPVLFTVPAQATTLYTNGPISGQLGGVGLYSPNAVSEAFKLGDGTTILSVTFGEWAVDGAALGNVDWSIGSAVYGSDLGSATGVSPTASLFCAAGGGCGDGVYDVYASSFTLDLALPAGTYWLTLQNATASAGLVFWDINGGPSLDETTCCGSAFPSESFTIAGTVPEPGNLGLVGAGLILLLAAGLRRASRHFAC
jgi:hypothetical protein